MKNNERLGKAIIAEILRWAKADLLSGLDNCSEYAVLDKKSVEGFGFSKKKVMMLWKKNLMGRKQERVFFTIISYRLCYSSK